MEGTIVCSSYVSILLTTGAGRTNSPEIVIHGCASANQLLDLIWVPLVPGGEFVPLRDAAWGGRGEMPWVQGRVVADDGDLGPGTHRIGDRVKLPFEIRGR